MCSLTTSYVAPTPCSPTLSASVLGLSRRQSIHQCHGPHPLQHATSHAPPPLETPSCSLQLTAKEARSVGGSHLNIVYFVVGAPYGCFLFR
jgi:hypothetical protein